MLETDLSETTAPGVRVVGRFEHVSSNRLFGYGPKLTQDKLRVAEALEERPEIAGELQTGGINFSVARELTRVAVPSTEKEWLEAARGRTVRDVEQLVSGHGPGSLPDDVPDFTEPHHLERRCEGGKHLVDNLVILCGAHHRAAHSGSLVISGTPSSGLSFAHADGTPYGGAVAPAVADTRTKAFQALVGMGFRESEAKRALARLPHSVSSLEQGIVEHRAARIAQQPSWRSRHRRVARHRPTPSSIAAPARGHRLSRYTDGRVPRAGHRALEA